MSQSISGNLLIAEWSLVHIKLTIGSFSGLSSAPSDSSGSDGGLEDRFRFPLGLPPTGAHLVF